MPTYLFLDLNVCQFYTQICMSRYVHWAWTLGYPHNIITTRSPALVIISMVTVDFHITHAKRLYWPVYRPFHDWSVKEFWWYANEIQHWDSLLLGISSTYKLSYLLPSLVPRPQKERPGTNCMRMGQHFCGIYCKLICITLMKHVVMLRK